MLRIFLSFIFILSIFSKNVFANWDAMDSPDFIAGAGVGQNHEIIRQMGDYMQFAPMAVALGFIAYYGDTNLHKVRTVKDLISLERYKDDGLSQLVFTTGASMASTAILKEVVGRPRPMQVENGESWGMGHKSFPSGHATIAFAPAMFIAKRYGWLKAAPALAIASFVGYSRVAAKAHYLTDVGMAAALSFAYAYLFTFEKKIGDITVSFGPPMRAQIGLGINLRW